jgi:ATP-dependent Clp protease ATP-binding subunit ClpA
MDAETYVVPCTERVERILLSARATADVSGHTAVRDVDLLTAFVKDGGGNVGRVLRVSGLTLEALASSLDGEDGLLKREQFEGLAWRVLEGAVECARRKAHGVVGRRHLIYSMLMQPESSLSNITRSQQKDPESLAGILYSGMQTGTSLSSMVELRFADLAREMLRILCSAEAEAKDAAEGVVSESRLFQALSSDGGGEAGMFLQKCGLKWHGRQRPTGA